MPSHLDRRERYAYFGDRTLVYRLAYNDDIVAFKMGRRSEPDWQWEGAYLN